MKTDSKQTILTAPLWGTLHGTFKTNLIGARFSKSTEGISPVAINNPSSSIMTAYLISQIGQGGIFFWICKWLLDFLRIKRFLLGLGWKEEIESWLADTFGWSWIWYRSTKGDFFSRYKFWKRGMKLFFIGRESDHWLPLSLIQVMLGRESEDEILSRFV